MGRGKVLILDADERIDYDNLSILRDEVEESKFIGSF
jgi:hypothetical protein